jgi:hypothetical protein
MSRFMKVFTGLVVVVTALAGWTSFTGRNSDQSVASAATSETSPSLVAPSPTPNPLSNPADGAGSLLLTAGEVAVANLGGSGPTEESARAFAVLLVNLDERRLTGTDENATQLTAAVAAAGSRDVLVAQAVRQSGVLRTEFGPDTKWFNQALRVRTVSVSATNAAIDVWWVKIVTSPGRATAGDIWGTTRFSLVWENGTWKIANEESRLGPWPTHSRTEVQHPSGARFRAELEGFEPVAVTQ